jgi:hypothetical protein
MPLGASIERSVSVPDPLPSTTFHRQSPGPAHASILSPYSSSLRPPSRLRAFARVPLQSLPDLCPSVDVSFLFSPSASLGVVSRSFPPLRPRAKNLPRQSPAHLGVFLCAFARVPVESPPDLRPSVFIRGWVFLLIGVPRHHRRIVPSASPPREKSPSTIPGPSFRNLASSLAPLREILSSPR